VKKLLIVIVATAYGALSMPFVSAIDPNVMTDIDKTLIVSKCFAAQRTLQVIQRNDPSTRLRRGNIYANFSQLMSAMNGRMAFNNMNVPSISSAASKLQELREQFSRDYTTYEIELRNLVLMDCSAKPQEFYRSLISVRARRADIATRIKEIDAQLVVFQQGLDELHKKIGDKR